MMIISILMEKWDCLFIIIFSKLQLLFFCMLVLIKAQRRLHNFLRRIRLKLP